MSRTMTLLFAFPVLFWPTIATAKATTTSQPETITLRLPELIALRVVSPNARAAGAAQTTEVSRMLYGVNVARWDLEFFPTSATPSLETGDANAIAKLAALQPGFLKYPGGNDADSYVWNADSNPPEDMDTAEFLFLAKHVQAPGFFTVNFGAGPELAADWAKATRRLGAARTAMMWEVGDEVWGPWAKSHVPGEEYGRRFREFATAIRRAQPGAKLAANLSLSNPDTSWTAAALSTLGDSFDIVTMTYFPQDPPKENDAALYASAEKFRERFARLENYVARTTRRTGTQRPQYCLVGFNSTSTKPGPQTKAIATAIWMAQMYGSMAEMGTDMAAWWAWRNPYPQRGGDYGLLLGDGANTPNYTYGAMLMLSPRFYGTLTDVRRSDGTEFFTLRRADGRGVLLALNTTKTARTMAVTLQGAGGGARNALLQAAQDTAAASATQRPALQVVESRRSRAVVSAAESPTTSALLLTSAQSLPQQTPVTLLGDAASSTLNFSLPAESVVVVEIPAAQPASPRRRR